MRKVLCIAYHFPPIRVSSGIQRTLKFATYLRDHAWEAIILTVHPRAYEITSPDQMDEVPRGMLVHRSFALDTARQLAIFGTYPNWLAIPDRYWTWAIKGVFDGLKLIRQHRPAAIFSTYPVATAHLIGAILHRITGLPWIADFRDSMTEEGYPVDPMRWRAFRGIERYAVTHATRCVFTTEGTRGMYESRYPQQPVGRWAVIPNGFDEDNFADAEAIASLPTTLTNRPVRLVHSGALYPSERDPTQLFQAIRQLKFADVISARDVRIALRATGHDELYRRQLSTMNIDDVVELLPGVTYREALVEMLSSDGLLLLQATNSNHQIPAKLYEYIRAGRPILALTDPRGDTAQELRSAGFRSIVPLDDLSAIKQALPEFIDRLRGGTETGSTREQAFRYSRRAAAASLAELLDHAIDQVR